MFVKEGRGDSIVGGWMVDNLGKSTSHLIGEKEQLLLGLEQ